MIVVTGTKRSGTSMWMSALAAGGFEPIGIAYPASWGTSIRDANTGGFFESLLRVGIHHGTNPNPKTGRYIHHEDSRTNAVKIFAGGFVRTHRAFIDSVVMTVRPWREYVASLTRLYRMEHAAAEKALGGSLRPRVVPDPALEWWVDNFLILEDLALRGFPANIITYDNALADPLRFVGETVRGIGGDGDAAAASIHSDQRTQSNIAPYAHSSLSEGIIDVFDTLYETLNAGDPISPAFWKRMRSVQQDLAPDFMKGVRAAQEDQLRWARDVRAAAKKRRAT
ncbi:MAG: hypothetical protein AB8H86_30735 [Polyangiales bacterium]